MTPPEGRHIRCRLRWILLTYLFSWVLRSALAHRDNHAVILSSSRYWFNYRHTINALSIYNLLKENGYSDDNIVLMLADEYASNPRNPFPDRLLARGKQGPSLYDGQSTEIDYRGSDVTVQNLVRVLTGRQVGGLPTLQSTNESNVLIYITGHGGDQFFKFQDVEEILASDIAHALEQMEYEHVLFLADTCQAFTLGDKITAPNVTFVGSSLRGESSYAHHSDADLGLSIIERYTYSLTEYLHNRRPYGQSLQQVLIDPHDYAQQRAHISYKDDTSVRKMTEIPVSDFFVAKQATSEKPARPVVIAENEGLLFSSGSWLDSFPDPVLVLEDDLSDESTMVQDEPVTAYHGSDLYFYALATTLVVTITVTSHFI